eukprot:ANDGO_03770.mRNA.1 hypothetical protein
MIEAICITALPLNKPILIRSFNPAFRQLDLLSGVISSLSPSTEHAVEPWGPKSLVYGAMDDLAIYLLGSNAYGEVACSDIMHLMFNNIRQLAKEKALRKENLSIPQLSMMVSLMIEDGEVVRKDFPTIKKMIKGKS